MRFPKSKALGGLAAAGILALVTTVSSPATAQQDQTTTEFLTQCNTNTGDIAQFKACLKSLTQILGSTAPGQSFNVLLNVLGDKMNGIMNDPVDPDVSTPPAPSDPTSDDGNGQ